MQNDISNIITLFNKKCTLMTETINNIPNITDEILRLLEIKEIKNLICACMDNNIWYEFNGTIWINRTETYVKNIVRFYTSIEFLNDDKISVIFDMLQRELYTYSKFHLESID